jgi:hypothetical protein
MKPGKAPILLILLTAGILAWSCRAHADVDRIELNDGSVIQGEIVSYSGGVYTIKSENLGIINIEKSKIRSIRSEPEGTSEDRTEGAGADAIKDQVKALQEMMAASPDVMKSIEALQNDPDFQSVLTDPELMKAVNSGDISKLLASPKFNKLLDKPAVQEIGRKVAP